LSLQLLGTVWLVDVERVSAAQHTDIAEQVLHTVVQLVVVAETVAVQQDNAVHNTAIVALLLNTVVGVVATAVVATAVILMVEVVLAVPLVALRDHVVRHMDFVETLLHTVEELAMVTVVIQLVVLVFVAHDLDIVMPMVLTVLSLNSYPVKRQLFSKVNLKEKQHITTRPWQVRIIVPVV